MTRIVRSSFAAAVIGAALSLSGCVTSPSRMPEEAPLTWPEAVDVPARVAFVKAFSRPEEFGIKKSVLQRLGEFLFGAADARLVRPTAVVAVDGVVFVADPGAKGVHRFDAAANRYDLIALENGAPLPSPVGLAAGSEGEVYVTDSVKAELLVIRRGAKAAVPLLAPKLGQPTGVAFDPATGQLFVVDTTAHRINVVDRAGKLVHSFGERGDGDGQFNYPTHLWRDGHGRLYVTDALNFRIQVLDERGRPIAKFGQAGDGTGDFMRHKGVATDSYGHVYVVDGLISALQIFDPQGRLLLVLGNLGRSRGEFWLPNGVFISPSDEIYVADSYNGRVQVFRYVGGPT